MRISNTICLVVLQSNGWAYDDVQHNHIQIVLRDWFSRRLHRKKDVHRAWICVRHTPKNTSPGLNFLHFKSIFFLIKALQFFSALSRSKRQYQASCPSGCFPSCQTSSQCQQVAPRMVCVQFCCCPAISPGSGGLNSGIINLGSGGLLSGGGGSINIIPIPVPIGPINTFGLGSEWFLLTIGLLFFPTLI